MVREAYQAAYLLDAIQSAEQCIVCRESTGNPVFLDREGFFPI